MIIKGSEQIIAAGEQLVELRVGISPDTDPTARPLAPVFNEEVEENYRARVWPQDVEHDGQYGVADEPRVEYSIDALMAMTNAGYKKASEGLNWIARNTAYIDLLDPHTAQSNWQYNYADLIADTPESRAELSDHYPQDGLDRSPNLDINVGPKRRLEQTQPSMYDIAMNEFIMTMRARDVAKKAAAETDNNHEFNAVDAYLKDVGEKVADLQAGKIIDPTSFPKDKILDAIQAIEGIEKYWGEHPGDAPITVKRSLAVRRKIVSDARGDYFVDSRETIPRWRVYELSSLWTPEPVLAK